MKSNEREAFVRQVKSAFSNDQWQVGVILRLLNELDHLESEICQLKERHENDRTEQDK